jgi:hypothetical protein
MWAAGVRQRPSRRRCLAAKRSRLPARRRPSRGTAPGRCKAVACPTCRPRAHRVGSRAPRQNSVTLRAESAGGSAAPESAAAPKGGLSICVSGVPAPKKHEQRAADLETDRQACTFPAWSAARMDPAPVPRHRLSRVRILCGCRRQAVLLTGASRRAVADGGRGRRWGGGRDLPPTPTFAVEVPVLALLSSRGFSATCGVARARSSLKGAHAHCIA